MNKISFSFFLSFLVFFNVLIGSEISSNTFLFCLKPQLQPLQISLNRSEVKVGLKELDVLLNDNHVIKVERWLKAANNSHQIGDIFLNKIYRAYVSDDRDGHILNVINKVNAHSFILYAENEYKHSLFYIPNDPAYGNQCSLESVNANLAWDYWDIINGQLPTNDKILLVSVDTGVDYTHSDLIRNIWINQGEIPEWLFELPDLDDGDGVLTAIEIANFMQNQTNSMGENYDFRDALTEISPFTDGIDNDGNGYVDDILGWDASGESGNPDNDPFPNTGNGILNSGGWAHGTHVAGILGATTDNGIGMSSTAFDLKIMSVKASREDGEDINEPMIDNGYEGIFYAAYTGYLHGYNTVINASWGRDGIGNSEQGLLDLAFSYGAIIVAAAGNGDEDGNTESYELHYPASHENVVSVCALQCNGVWGGWATYHESVDLAAPGDNIYSTIMQGGYQSWDGSSMASPNAASVIGLVWSYHDLMTNTEIIEMVKATADSSIYDINPDYLHCNDNEGLYVGDYCLGAGMVDAHKAIAQGFSPNLQASDYSFTEIVGDGDGLLNPGEIGYLSIYLKNSEGWADALDVTGKLTSNDSNIIILDEMGNYGNIMSGDSILNNLDQYKISISSDIDLGQLEFDFEISANSDVYDYERTYSYEKINISINQKGFPISTSELRSSPLVIDLDGDGDMEIILGDNLGFVRIYDKEGVEIINDTFPYNTHSQIWGSASAADIDSDGLVDFVITSKSKHMYAFDKNGLKFDYDADKYLMGTSSIGNLDDDEKLEIVIGGYSSPSNSNEIFVINHDGTSMEGFPFALGEKVKAGITLYDFNDNGKDDLIFGTDDNNLYVIYDDTSIAPGFPYHVGDKIQSSPIIKQVDGEKIIFVGSNDHNFYAINEDGTLRYSIATGDKVLSFPSILNYNDSTYVFFGSNDMIYAIDINGNSLSGWPMEINGNIVGSVVFSDIDGNNAPEIIAATDNGMIYVFHVDGTIYHNFPINNDFPFSGSPMIIDLDSDVDLEILVGSGSNLLVLDLKEKGSTQNYWSEFQGGYERRGGSSIGGCMDMSFCNYDAMAVWDDGSCSIRNYNCNDNTIGCDCAGVCNGLSIEDCHGVCNGNSLINECGDCSEDIFIIELTCDSIHHEECSNKLGDLNIDSSWNVIDVIALVNCVLMYNCNEIENGCTGDMDGDGSWNVIDVVALTNCILNASCDFI